MISLQSGYRSFNRLLPFWFPFFSFLKLEFPITISNHSVLLFSAVALAKWIKEVSAIPGFSLNTLSESSSSLLERNADCLPTEHRDATQWQNIALGLWNQGTSDFVTVQLNRLSEAPNHPLIFCSLCLFASEISITLCGILDFWEQASIPVTLCPRQAKVKVFADGYFAASRFQ